MYPPIEPQFFIYEYQRIKKKINVFHGIEKEREKMLLFQKKKKTVWKKIKIN